MKKQKGFTVSPEMMDWYSRVMAAFTLGGFKGIAFMCEVDELTKKMEKQEIKHADDRKK